MWRFYLRALRSGLPKALLDSLKRTEGGIGVVFLVLLLANKPVGQKFMNWEGGISPWWALVPAGALLLWSALKANYAEYVAQGAQYEADIARLVASGAVPAYDAKGFRKAWLLADKDDVDKRIALLVSQIRDFLVASGPRMDAREGSARPVRREFKLLFEQPIIELVRPLIQDGGWLIDSRSIFFHLDSCSGESSMDAIANALRDIRRMQSAEDEPPPF